jgi:hypothetical protein
LLKAHGSTCRNSQLRRHQRHKLKRLPHAPATFGFQVTGNG